jgi:hypothetical protein
MNEARRKDIAKAVGLIEEAKSILEQARGDEYDYFDNMPESFQSGEKGERASEAADALQEAVDACDEIVGTCERAVEA